MNTIPSLTNYLLCLCFIGSFYSNSYGQTDLFFSEYIEGSANNKCLEVFNPTLNPVDLSLYTIEIYNNGSTSPGNATFSIGERVSFPTLAPSQTVVLCAALADIGLKSASDGTFKFGSFNGDDAIILRKNGSIIDAIGAIGCDPGLAWNVGGKSTRDATLIRIPCISKGTSSGCSFSSLGTEWNDIGFDNFSNIGSHNFGVPNVEIMGNNALCENPFIQLEATTGFTAYKWSTGSSSRVITVSNSGTYRVTVTSSQGCKAETSKKINGQSPEIFADITAIQAVSCRPKTDGGFTVSPSGGSGGFSYDWGNASSTNPRITGLGAGDYVVTVMDDNGCAVEKDVTIGGPVTVPLNVSKFGETCKGRGDGRIILSASGSNLEYSINGINFQSNGTFTDLLPGNYRAIVVDNAGCGDEQKVTISGGTKFTLRNSLVTQAKCQATGGGQIILRPEGGQSPYVVSFDGGPFINNQVVFSNLQGGTYDIVIRDNSGCEKAFEQIIDQGSNMEVSYDTIPATCLGINDGGIIFHVKGSSQNLSFRPIDENGSLGIPRFDTIYKDLSVGLHKYVVRDNPFDCNIEVAFEITEQEPLLTDVISPLPCDTAALGQISVVPQNGVTPYQFKLADGPFDTIANFRDLAPADYVVTTQDANGCIKIDSIKLEVTDSIKLLDVIRVKPQCQGANNGQLIVMVEGGKAPYSYQLDGGDFQVDSTFQNLNQGTYSITVKDANDCQQIFSSINLADGDTFDATCNVVQNISAVRQIDGAVRINIMGGEAPYNAQLVNANFNNVISLNEQVDFNNLPAGDYDVEIIDNNGCKTTCQFTITTPPCNFSFSIKATDVTCFDTKDGSITLELPTSNEPYSINWFDTIFNGQSNLTNLDIGGYEVTVSTPSGCSDTKTASISQPPALIAEIIANNTTICQKDSTQLSLRDSYTNYSWSNNSTNTALTIYQAGTYQVTVQDEKGCKASDAITINEIEQDTIYEKEWTCDVSNVGTFAIEERGIDGCTDMVFRTLNLARRDSTNLRATTCNPSDAGMYTSRFTNTFGCDSLVITTVDLLRRDTTYLEEYSCKGADLGMRYQNLINAAGCDSILVIETKLDTTIERTFLNATTCSPSNVGVDTTYLRTLNGCDSLVITTVDLLRRDTTYLSEYSCRSEDLGMRYQNLINAVGCDSILVIETKLDMTIEWTFLNATTCSPSNVGVDTTYLWTLSGCDSLVITTVDLLRRDTTYLNEYSCKRTDLVMRYQNLINAAGCDSVLAIEIKLDTTIELTFLTATNCSPSTTGMDTTYMQNLNGCDSLIITKTISNASEPTFLTTNTCNPSNVGVDSFTYTNYLFCDSLVIINTQLVPSHAISLTAESCNPQDTGQTTQYLVNQSGCDSIVQITTALRPIDNCQVSFLAAADTVCWGTVFGAIDINVQSGIPPYDYFILNDFWRDTLQKGILNTNNESIENIPIGRFSLLLKDAQGLKQEKRIEVVQAPQLEVEGELSDYFGFGISCEGRLDGTIQVQIENGKTPFKYLWGTGDTTQLLNNLGVGTYEVTVTDAENCSQSTTFELTANEPIAIEYEAFRPTCFSDESGKLVLRNIPNASGLMEYSLDGIIFQPILQFPFTIPNIPAGDYSIFVQNENTCQADTTFTILESLEYQVSLGVPKNLLLGDSINLTPKGNFEIVNYEWTADVPLLCTDCPTLNIKTTKSGQIQLIAYDENGCPATAITNIQVRKGNQVFLPNVFSPNGDGLNDVYQIFTGPSVTEIKQFQIYDYEGRLMYQTRNQAANDVSVAWDGLFNGQKMLPAVFVVMVEVELLDGTRQEYAQTMTLVE